tara:strand:+ start:1997 stop:2218 length:222 start_codon:yes stop_codon:yes gene_type:complete
MKNDFDKIFRNMKAKDYMKTRPYPPFTHKISISKIDNLMEQYANERVIEELENLDNAKYTLFDLKNRIKELKQ